jgi:uncharacterized membrane protein
MEGIIFLLVMTTICGVLAGPAALIIAVIALNKSKQLYDKLQDKDIISKLPARDKPRTPQVPTIRQVPKPVHPGQKQVVVPQTSAQVEERELEAEKEAQKEAFRAAAERIRKREEKIIGQPTIGLEQRIGTRWVAIAGTVAVIVSAALFLKYAYDNWDVGPLARVLITAIAGLAALVVGEITRRRGYEIVAKCVTALGFGLLYTTVFSAYRWYGLIGTTPAFILAILVTAAAMFYAVALDEVVMAVLSLFGGFCTPVIVSTGENLPMPLFGYALVLGAGAMLCAYYRKWRTVNILAFVGTFVLYTGWFEKFYRPAMEITKAAPEQMAVALCWLAVFFAVYLVLPILYELINKVKADKEDILCVLANAAVTFYYLCAILFDEFRTELAFCAVGLCLVHLAMMAVVAGRCKEDVNLRLGLLAVALFFLTVAMPLYFKMHALAMAWVAQGAILAVIGLRYRSNWTQAGSTVALFLSFFQLLNALPMHNEAFRLLFNPAFGTWLFVAAVLFVCSVIYRLTSALDQGVREFVAQIYYGLTVLLLASAAAIEWHCHCEYNLVDANSCFSKGFILILAATMALFVIRPLCPNGPVGKLLATAVAGGGAIFTSTVFTEFHKSGFSVFANVDFGIAVVFVTALFATAFLLRCRATEDKPDDVFGLFFVLAGIFVLWILMTEEIFFYWHCRNKYMRAVANWESLANMYISIMWAVYGVVLMAAGFWRRASVLRYIALGLFALLLAKVFILDTATVKSVYRIAAFLTTGIALVGVSYLYQFLKNKGFFEIISAQIGSDK